MAAYQCLNCEQIAHGDDDCCDNPDLFCINDMPSEIMRLRNELDSVRLEIRGCAQEMATMGNALIAYSTNLDKAGQ